MSTKTELEIVSAGAFASNRYIGWILRPSGRIVPLPKSGSSVGISFILATTAAPQTWRWTG